MKRYAIVRQFLCDSGIFSNYLNLVSSLFFSWIFGSMEMLQKMMPKNSDKLLKCASCLQYHPEIQFQKLFELWWLCLSNFEFDINDVRNFYKYSFFFIEMYKSKHDLNYIWIQSFWEVTQEMFWIFWLNQSKLVKRFH